jgi:rubrerythrin
MPDLMTAVATAGQAIGRLKEIGEQPLDEAQRKLKLAETMSLVADLKNALVEANAEARSKDQEIDTLRKNFRLFTSTVEVLGYHYDRDDKGRPKGSAFCPVCMQKEGYMLLLTGTQERGRPEQQCPNCKAFYSGLSVFK